MVGSKSLVPEFCVLVFAASRKPSETKRDGVSRFFRSRHLWNGAFSAPITPILAIAFFSPERPPRPLAWALARTSDHTVTRQKGPPRSPAAARFFAVLSPRGLFHEEKKK
jgi:hypothetical protein